MMTGIVGSLAMTLSGQLVASQGGNITTMLLLMIPIPKLLAALLWVPIFRTYPENRKELHNLLLERREKLSGK